MVKALGAQQLQPEVHSGLHRLLQLNVTELAKSQVLRQTGVLHQHLPQPVVEHPGEKLGALQLRVALPPLLQKGQHLGGAVGPEKVHAQRQAFPGGGGGTGDVKGRRAGQAVFRKLQLPFSLCQRFAAGQQPQAAIRPDTF